MAKVVNMYSFEESALLAELGSVEVHARVAFAAAAATRQVCNYERHALIHGVEHAQRPREIVARLWSDLSVADVDRVAWEATLEEVMDLLPEEGDAWVIQHALVDDALTTLAYAIRCFLSSDPQESVWAARCAYEAADQAAIRILGVQPGLPNTELVIKTHVVVQRELARQQHDFDSLLLGSIDAVRSRAYADQLLTDQEFSKVV